VEHSGRHNRQHNRVEGLKYIPEETRRSTEGILDYIEEHIKESTNPIVEVVELLTMKRFSSESADHLNAGIQDKINQCDFSKVTDVREYIGFLATMVAVRLQPKKKTVPRQGRHVCESENCCQNR
jgi:hypothetical protein